MKIVLLFLFFQTIFCIKNNTYTFKLDNKDEVYTPNDKVSGKLIVKTSGEQQIDTIIVRFLGDVSVEITTAKEVYRSSISPIVNDTKSYSDKQLLAKGKTLEYKFNFKIPADALMSLEDYPAHVRYSLIVEDKNGGVQQSHIITVLDGIDLSKSTKSPEPSTCSGVSSKSGIKFKATTPNKTFATNEKVPVEIVIDNKSWTKSVESMEARLSVNFTTFAAVGGKVFKANEKANFEDIKKFWRTSGVLVASSLKKYENHVSKWSKENKFTIYAENNLDALSPIKVPTIPNLPSFIQLNHFIDVTVLTTNDLISCKIPVTIAIIPQKSSKAKKLPIGKSDQETFQPLYPQYRFDQTVEI